jgi:protein-L-isoaspartate(D-aspartate) O-methyltransferase
MEHSRIARQNMVDSQIRPNDVTDPALVAAFLAVPREAFVARERAGIAYSETEIETSPGRALWLARDFAKLIAALRPRSEQVALLIAAGAGYECAVLQGVMQSVVGLDEDEALVNATSDRLASLGFDRVAVVQGSLAEGLPDEGPFDVILVNGMVETVPEAWTRQLAEGGRLGVVVQEGRVGRARVYTRSGDAVAARTVFEASPPRLAGFGQPVRFTF